jgi:hypothetical protein
MVNGNSCPHEKGTDFELNVQINCDAEAVETTFTFDEESISEKNQCSPKIIMNS